MAGPPRVAVVGGGIAGSLCALALRRHGAEPTIFDMGRRAVGGRLGTPSTSSRGHDPGAQFMCAADQGSHFAHVLRFLEQNGLVRAWTGRFGVLGSKGGGFLPKEVIDGSILGGLVKDGGAQGQMSGGDGDFCGFLGSGSHARFYVGTPSMASVCAGICRLAALDVRQGVQVTDMKLDGGTWSVSSSSKERAAASDRGFHALVIATHNPSLAAHVVRHVATDLQQQVEHGLARADGEVAPELFLDRLRGLAAQLQALRDLHKLPAYVLSASFQPGTLASRLPFDAVACPTSEQIQFISREASKPGREGPDLRSEELWTAVSTASFARELLMEGDDDAAAARLSDRFAELLRPSLEGSEPMPVPVQASAKCWKAGFTARTLGLQEDCVSLQPWRLAICGDFLRSHASPIEAAALSGLEAGERVASWFAA